MGTASRLPQLPLLAALVLFLFCIARCWLAFFIEHPFDTKVFFSLGRQGRKHAWPTSAGLFVETLIQPHFVSCFVETESTYKEKAKNWATARMIRREYGPEKKLCKKNKGRKKE